MTACCRPPMFPWDWGFSGVSVANSGLPACGEMSGHHRATARQVTLLRVRPRSAPTDLLRLRQGCMVGYIGDKDVGHGSNHKPPSRL